MIHAALGRGTPVELTIDPRIQRRVARLAVVSTVALGLVLGVAVATVHPHVAFVTALGVGWVSMPTFLAASLHWPGIRYLVVLPATLVTVGLLGIDVTALPASAAAATGWLLMTGGVVFGGCLGLWLWFRLVPVPAALDDPLALGRWGLIAVHVALVVGGWLLAARPLVG